ncbi:hypothetical protein UCREL1_5116 [Eutypa lata UCREL1]|uniref:Uncharacterized protein n=1 Tax=Eutypa lata (strain UCR-EL1) TaxID=1287681 RepID=M7SUD0_EUTLA|nr:hypothetical protein UCREL1_5116 [Eutypa lata UCREL1]
MSRHSLLTTLTLGIWLLGLPLKVMTQDAPLFIQGGFEDATATDDSYNTGGTISLNGFTITVPTNVLVQFPAAWVPWKDFVEDKEAMIGYEINAIGNFINGEPIAAQILAYEFFEGLNSGFIESIDHEDGSMKISAGPTLRISDPNAVFSVGFDEAPFFTADDESPSISSFSGFPMCIPRNSSDPACPASNRPFQGSGTFMAPFLPGDFVTFQGIRRGNEFICFSIIAENVQILTLGDMVYVRMELGLLGISNFNPNAELAESRFIGFVSNSRATVALYAMDYDPCTGEVTDRIVAALGLRGGGNEQNKFEYRADLLTGYAREYRVVTEIDGVPKTRTTKNNLLAGTYVQPVNVWVQGEQAIPGTPPPPYDFSQMPWLTQGVGIDADGNLWGPLDPFPQTGVIIDAPQCGDLSATDFRGDEVDTDWVPSATLLNDTLPLNSTTTLVNTTSEVVITNATPDDSGVARKRNVSSGRWLTRARLEAEVSGDDDSQTNRTTAA